MISEEHLTNILAEEYGVVATHYLIERLLDIIDEAYQEGYNNGYHAKVEVEE